MRNFGFGFGHFQIQFFPEKSADVSFHLFCVRFAPNYSNDEIISVSGVLNPFIAKVPLHVYREIEVKLKEQIHFKPIEEGKQLNYIMLAWMQKPQGKLPPLPPPGSLM